MARFETSQLVDPTSAYVSPPWELFQKNLQDKQAVQDQYKNTVNLLDKPFDQLTNDTNGALAAKTAVEDKLAGLRNLDYNNPSAKDQIYNTIKDVQNMYSPQGEIGLYQNKHDQFAAEYKNIEEIQKKDPTKGTYLKTLLMNEAQDPNRAIKKDANGQFINTTVNTPQDFVFKDPNKAFDDALATAAYDAYSSQPGLAGITQAGALEMYKQGKGTQLTKQKIDQDLMASFGNDPDLINSAKALTFNDAIKQGYSQQDALSLSEQEGSFIQQDKNGNLTWNNGTLLGSLADGRGTAAAYIRPDDQYTFEHNAAVEEKQKKDINNPPPVLTGQELQDLQFGTALSTTAKVTTNIANSEQAIRDEYAKLLIANGKTPENAKADANNTAVSIDAISNYVKQYGDQSLTPKISNAITNYKLTKELDDAATANAIKTSGVDPTKLQDIVSKSTDPVIRKMTVADVISLNNLQIEVEGTAMDSPGTESRKKIDADIAAINAIHAKYGIAGEVSYGALGKGIDTKSLTTTYNAINTAQTKLQKAKDDYLTSNSDQRLKENIVLSQNQVFKDVTDPVTGKVTQVLDETATTEINKQVDDNFTKGQYDFVPTTIPNPNMTTGANGEQVYYTLGEYKQSLLDAADPAGKIVLQNQFNKMKPQYSQYAEVDGSGNLVKPMYVTVGGQSVKIDQSLLKVNYGQGQVGLDQLNSTERAQTENYIANISAHGVRDHVTTTTDGLQLHIITTKQASGAANNNDLQIYATDSTGKKVPLAGTKPILTGEEATQMLTTLRRNKIITE